jgi:hypothetical protein
VILGAALVVSTRLYILGNSPRVHHISVQQGPKWHGYFQSLRPFIYTQVSGGLFKNYVRQLTMDGAQLWWLWVCIRVVIIEKELSWVVTQLY